MRGPPLGARRRRNLNLMRNSQGLSRELPDHADLQRFWLALLSAVAGTSLRNRFGIARNRARHIPDLSERADRFSILASASGDGPRAEILNASPGAVGPASRLMAALC